MVHEEVGAGENGDSAHHLGLFCCEVNRLYEYTHQSYFCRYSIEVTICVTAILCRSYLPFTATFARAS